MSISLIPMIRDAKTAEVHPDEVRHMQTHGWSVVEKAPPAKTKTKKATPEKLATDQPVTE